MKKRGRPSDLLSDGVLYDTVEDYLRNGCIKDLAFELTARDYDEELKAKSTKKPEDPGYADYLCKTVDKAWRRTKKRIAFDRLPRGSEESGWRWKDEYLKNQRMWDEWMRDRPAYLKPETKNPATRAEIEDSVRAIRSALAPQRTKNKRPRS